MKNLTKDNFFQSRNYAVVWIILLISGLLFICGITNYKEYEALGICAAVGFIGILISGGILVTVAGKGSQAQESLNLIRELNLYEKMKQEFPQNTQKRIYHVSNTFVYGFHWHICIPLNMIVEIKTEFVNYIVGANKSRERVILTLANGDKYKLFDYYGYDTGHIKEIKMCLVQILQRNPGIVLNGKRVVLKEGK